MGWEMVKLGDVLEKVKSPRAGEESYPVLSITRNEGLVNQGERFGKRIASASTKDYKVVFRNELVVGFPIDEGVIDFQQLYEEAIVSPAYGIWRVTNPERVNLSFLARFLRSDRAIIYYQTKMRGTTARRRSLPDSLFLELPVPLPPLEEQQRIAKILGTVEKAIHFSLEALSARQLLRKSVIEKVLEQNSEAPSLALSQIAEISSGITKGRKVRPDALLTETPYLAVSNVKDGYLDLGTVSTIAITENEKSRFALHNGDILLTEGGDPDKLGRGVVWRGEIEGAIHQNHIFRCRLNEETNYNPEALMAVISSQRSRQYFLQCAKQTTGIATINKTQLSKLKVPDLDSGVLNRMQEMLHKVDNEILLSHRKIELLRELYASLSSRAFAGEL